MNKFYYLIITGLLSFDYLDNRMTKHILTPDVLLVILLVWIFVGLFFSVKKEDNQLDVFSNRKWTYLIVILLFVNTLHPFFEYHQSVLNTIIAQRANFAILFFLVLLRLQPSEDELFRVFKVLGILSIVIFILAFVFPQIFLDESAVKSLIIRQSRTTDLISFIPAGFTFAIFLAFMLIQRMLDQPSGKNIAWAFSLVLYIVLVQNRSTMLGLIPFVLYAIYKIKVRGKWIMITIVALVLGGYLSVIFSSLWDESAEQLSSNKYNRWQAISFFLVEWKVNLYTILFGQGMTARGSDYLAILMAAQKQRYAFISDIGLLGTYFYYGITMLIIVYQFVFKALFTRSFPVFMNFYALWILLVPTIHIFGIMSASEMIKFSFFFYLVIYYSNKKAIDENN